MAISNLYKRSNPGKTGRVSKGAKDNHVQWKDPIVEKVYQYAGLTAEEPHVHWRVPVVEEVHRYDSVNRHPRKIRPPNFEPEGILKETEEIESPEIDLPTTEDSVVEEVNIDQLANYPPLIPTEPNLISLETSPSDSFAQAAAIAAMDRHNPQTNSGATSNSHLLPRGNIESSSRAVDRSGSGTPDSFPDFHTSFMPANSNSPLDLFYIPLAFISFLNEFVEALVFGSPTTAQRRAAERIRQRARELDGNSRRHHPRSWNVVN